jgi:DNA ligase-1
VDQRFAALAALSGAGSNKQRKAELAALLSRATSLEQRYLGALVDEVLAWQTRTLLEREVAREGHVVHVRPELVVEIAFNDVQRSQYPGGLALRFARLVRYRDDRGAADADTIEAVRAIARAQGVVS